MKNFIFAALFAALLSACDQPQPPAVEKPSIPSVSNWHNLSENEFQEIERRCLGVNHPTCDDLANGRKSRKTLDEFRKATDRAVRAQDEYINGRK
jgi:hypothetical protein